MKIARLGDAQDSPFPNPDRALAEPNGLLAWGGALEAARLRNAYAQGIFPWYSDGQPILWWSPDPRAGFNPARMHVSRRLARWLRTCMWTIWTDTRFDQVVAGCAAPRGHDEGTWITPAMRTAYGELHRCGDAHSIEVLDGDQLVGGLYGVSSGGVFCAESMFSAATHASKVALLALAAVWSKSGGVWIDAQMPSSHLESMGAETIARSRYLELLASQRAAVPWPSSSDTARNSSVEQITAAAGCLGRVQGLVGATQ